MASVPAQQSPVATGNPFLEGIHAPVSEEVTLTDLKVTGVIPQELNGLYARIGPNPITPPNPAKHHWFIGDGMVHGVRLEEGSAQWYRNRYVRATTVSKALGEAPRPGPRAAASRVLDVVNTNIIQHAGRKLALVEAGSNPVELDDELETVAHTDFDGTLESSYSAHPHINPATGELHTICYSLKNPRRVYHVVLGTDGRVRRTVPLKVRGGPSIHDCMLTETYVIVLDLPITFSLKAAVSGYGFPYRWDDKHQARIGLLPLEGDSDDIIWCECDPCYIFHVLNAWDDGNGKVIMDAPAYPRIMDAAVSTAGPVGAAAKLERFVIDPASRSVTRTVIDPDGQEFARIDERFTGRRTRYGYALATGEPGPGAMLNDGLLYKHDFDQDRREVHNLGAGRVPGEFVLVPRSDDAPEGDGWLMGYAIDARENTTDLVIIDADDFSGPPVATITIPRRVPTGFHGNWLPDV